MKKESRFTRKHTVMALLLCVFIGCLIGKAHAAESRIPPAYPIPQEVAWLLDVASNEVGYREEDHGRTKYGEWAGDPYAQWCAEYLCWCVDQVDRQHDTHLLGNLYPRYSGSNTGRSWFINQGRYIVRWGQLEGWGYQWLKGSDRFLTTGDYIPQPGDWVFFTWTSDQDTDHVAMVEYCTRDETGKVFIHCLEGNTPVAVKRATYELTYSRILGFGTVHDAADWTIRGGNSGVKVRQLQEKLVRLGYLQEGQVDGVYGSGTAQAVRSYQEDHHLKQTSIANIETQNAMDRQLYLQATMDPSSWIVEDELDEDSFSLDQMTDVNALLQSISPTRGDDEPDWSLGNEDAGGENR